VYERDTNKTVINCAVLSLMHTLLRFFNDQMICISRVV